MVHPMIHSIQWISEDEAILTLTDGQNTCHVFAHPFHGHVGDPVAEPVLCFAVSGLLLVETGASSIRLLGGFKHEVVGQVVQVAPSLVRVGELLLSLDCPLPGDVLEGCFVIFLTQRLDYLG